jgi:hypothetical protein
MGRLYFEAIDRRDYDTIMGLTLMFSVLVLLGQLLADILYAVVDPRVAYHCANPSPPRRRRRAAPLRPASGPKPGAISAAANWRCSPCALWPCCALSPFSRR